MMLTIRRNTCIANFTDPELGLRCCLIPYSYWSPPDCHRVGRQAMSTASQVARRCAARVSLEQLWHTRGACVSVAGMVQSRTRVRFDASRRGCYRQ